VVKKIRKHVDDLREASRLIVDATERVTEVVEAMHNTIGGGPAVLGTPLAAPVRFINGLVYGSIRGVTRLVGASIDRALAELAPYLGESAPGPEREAVLSALNGVLGDYLAEIKSSLAIAMSLRHGGHTLALEEEPLREAIPTACGKLLVLIHGSSMNDAQWLRGGHDHGAELAREHGYTPLYLHYNSGLHVSTNGRELDGLLEQVVSAWPVPVEAIVLLGHSMGGLVARSACHYAETHGQTQLDPPRAWRSKLTKLITVGAPHHGAPLERGGNWVGVLLGVSRYSKPLARLAKLRSAGVTDLRFGNVIDEHWTGSDRFALGKDTRTGLPLPANVACYALAGTTSLEGASNPFGDGLVPVESALGAHRESHLTLAFPESNRFTVYGVSHLDLLSRPEVYAQLRAWLDDPPVADAPAEAH